MSEPTPEAQELLAQAASDYAEFNSAEHKAAYDYEQGFTGNNHGFTEQGEGQSD